MRCKDARDLMARLADEGGIAVLPELAGHVGSCTECGRAWRLHVRLLEELGEPPPVPEFADLAPRLLARLDRPRGGRPVFWRWAAAALVLAALLLGYLLGSQGTDSGSAPQTMAATYQEALSASPASSAEFALADNGAKPLAPLARSAP